MRSWKSHRLTSHTWLGLNPQIERPLSRIVVPLVYLFIYIDQGLGCNSTTTALCATCMSFEKRCRAVVKKRSEKFELN
jgi:hypothetical protein